MEAEVVAVEVERRVRDETPVKEEVRRGTAGGMVAGNEVVVSDGEPFGVLMMPSEMSVEAEGMVAEAARTSVGESGRSLVAAKRDREVDASDGRCREDGARSDASSAAMPCPHVKLKESVSCQN